MGQPLTHSVAALSLLRPFIDQRHLLLPFPLSHLTQQRQQRSRPHPIENSRGICRCVKWLCLDFGIDRLVESPCRPSKDSRNKLPCQAARKLYLVRKRTIEIGYLPNRSTLLSASSFGGTNGVARHGKEFIFLRLEWISNLSFWRWQPVKLRCT